MNKKPLISIITPFFNEEKFIEATIKSVLSQTYANWELILADDGSHDASTEIAKSFASAYPGRILYVEHPEHSNLGSSATRNLAIQCARGELVAFLDADDIFLPNYLENQVDVFSKTEASMVCEATLYWYSWAEGSSEHVEQRKDVVKPVGVSQDKLYRPGELNHLLYPLQKDIAAPCMCGLIVARDALLKHGRFEDEFRRNYTDQVFLSKIYLHEPVFISSSCNNYYRQRTDSCMSYIQSTKNYEKIRVQFLEWFASYVKNHDFCDPKLVKLINRNLLVYQHPLYYKVAHVYPRKIIKKFRRLIGDKNRQTKQ